MRTAPRHRRNRGSSPTAEGRALPQRAQRNTEEEASEDFTAKGAEVAKTEKQRERATATPKSEEKALQQRNPEDDQNPVLPQDSAEGIPGVESAKSIFFGVEAGEGVADNRPIAPPSEPPRKNSQSEVPGVREDLEQSVGM